MEAPVQKGKTLPHQRVLEEARRRHHPQGAADDASEILTSLNSLSLAGSPAASKMRSEGGGPSKPVEGRGSGNAKAAASSSQTLALGHHRKQAEYLGRSMWAKNDQGTQARVENKSGMPSAPTNSESALEPSLGLAVPSKEEEPLVFKSWPERVAREDSRIAKRRTITLTGLPEQATLEVVTAICKGTGQVESMKFSPVTKAKAAVTFVSASVAESFYKRTANGIEVKFPGDSKRYVISVDLDREAAVLSSLVQSRIDHGATRVIRIVGWRRDEVLGFLKTKGILPPPDASFSTIVWKVATAIAQGNLWAIESAKWDKNHLGHLVMLLTFSNLTTAYQGFSLLKREEAFEGCNVQFGDDP